MYRCKFFKIYELVPKMYHETYPENKLWLLFDNRVLLTLDLLREQYGKVVVNDWYFGGEFQLRGFRPADTTVGVQFSQHKFGRAFDCKFIDTPVGVVRQDCIDKRYECFKYITAIETGIPWFHFDTRNNDGKLITFEK